MENVKNQSKNKYQAGNIQSNIPNNGTGKFSGDEGSGEERKKAIKYFFENKMKDKNPKKDYRGIKQLNTIFLIIFLLIVAAGYFASFSLLEKKIDKKLGVVELKLAESNQKELAINNAQKTIDDSIGKVEFNLALTSAMNKSTVQEKLDELQILALNKKYSRYLDVIYLNIGNFISNEFPAMKIKYYDMALEINPKNSDVYKNRGTVNYNRNNFVEAISDFSAAIDVEPQNFVAYHNLAVAKYKTNDIIGGIDDATKAIEINPNYSNAYTIRGTLKYLNDDTNGAIQDYSKALEINSMDYEAYYRRGNLKENSGDLVGAVSDYKTAIQYAPDVDSKTSIKKLAFDKMKRIKTTTVIKKKSSTTIKQAPNKTQEKN
ncbi:MAG: tetratricopeptide repeat protein [Fusobacteriaceae bacterium]